VTASGTPRVAWDGVLDSPAEVLLLTESGMAWRTIGLATSYFPGGCAVLSRPRLTAADEGAAPDILPVDEYDLLTGLYSTPYRTLQDSPQRHLADGVRTLPRPAGTPRDIPTHAQRAPGSCCTSLHVRFSRERSSLVARRPQRAPATDFCALCAASILLPWRANRGFFSAWLY
jgi:hypothetical protein